MDIDEVISYLQAIKQSKGNLKVFLPSGFRYWQNEYTSNAPVSARMSHFYLREESYVTEEEEDTDTVLVLG